MSVLVLIIYLTFTSKKLQYVAGCLLFSLTHHKKRESVANYIIYFDTYPYCTKFITHWPRMCNLKYNARYACGKVEKPHYIQERCFQFEIKFV